MRDLIIRFIDQCWDIGDYIDQPNSDVCTYRAVDDSDLRDPVWFWKGIAQEGDWLCSNPYGDWVEVLRPLNSHTVMRVWSTEAKENRKFGHTVTVHHVD